MYIIKAPNSQLLIASSSSIVTLNAICKFLFYDTFIMHFQFQNLLLPP
jgi:hypothetical protein